MYTGWLGASEVSVINLGPRLLVELGLALPARHGGGDPGWELLQRPPRGIPGEVEVLRVERAHRAVSGHEAVPGGPDAAAERRDGAQPRHDHAAAGRWARRRQVRTRGEASAEAVAEQESAANHAHQALPRS